MLIEAVSIVVGNRDAVFDGLPVGNEGQCLCLANTTFVHAWDCRWTPLYI